MLLRTCTIARYALALLMLIGTVNMVIELVHPGFFPAHHPFMQLLIDSRYLLVPKLLELAGGLLLFTRYRALAMTLLWPVIVNIALFHAFIEPRYALNGPILLVLAALASWPERHAWSGLLSPTPP
jgi:putative oxidoreductase